MENAQLQRDIADPQDAVQSIGGDERISLKCSIKRIRRKSEQLLIEKIRGKPWRRRVPN